MNVRTFLPPERVQEISTRFKPAAWEAERAINAAAPEIARAALEWAAKECEKEADAFAKDEGRKYPECKTDAESGLRGFALVLERAAKEIEP